ncbi:hypothetical protein [Saccharothrix yanglingensis]|uniref:Uncharacterized protein n=1 Tax=Saccharothrix yanglingensis TaxID=659496 RepID=A0ABU0X9A2_9PSEU|nr:hypothetical protein [Saccharothrix yanglingensis]MDQ2588714.1 hypothetical protein [Saccharothrix yanglingensis]
MTITIPGVGDLPPVVDHVPAGLSCWGTVDGETPISVIVEAPATADDLDLPFVAGVPTDRDRLEATARAAVEDAFRDRPGFSPDGVADPGSTFHPGRDWLTRFADVAAPGLDELGVMVVFRDEEVIGVDDLTDPGELHGHEDG